MIPESDVGDIGYVARSPTPPRVAYAELSFVQERLWHLARRPGARAMRAEVTLWAISGALRLETFESALATIVARHDALRTTFVDTGGAPAAAVAPFAGFTLPVERVEALPAPLRDEAVRRLAWEERTRAIALDAGPLFRVRLLRLGDAEHVLLLAIPRIVADDASVRVLFRELSSFYEAYEAGVKPSLIEPPMSHAEHAAWERAQWLHSGQARQVSYWTRRLKGARAVAIPREPPSHAVADAGRVERVRLELPLTMLRRLRAMSRREGVTLPAVLLAAFQLLLAKMGGTDDVVVGTPMVGRARPESEGTIGPFMDTLVLRTDLSGAPPVRELLRRVRGVVRNAYAHRDVSFARLMDELRGGTREDDAPLVRAMFAAGPLASGAWPGASAESVGRHIAGRTLRRLDVSDESGTLDAMLDPEIELALDVHPQPRGLDLLLTYDTSLFTRHAAQRMLRRLAHLLEQMAGDAGLRLPALHLLEAGERTLTPDGWHRTDVVEEAATGPCESGETTDL